jgi:hypothetical protein
MMKINLKKIIEDNKVLLALSLMILILIITNLNKLEGYTSRLMYIYNPHAKNQSRDIRGDQKIIKQDVGKFWQSSYENNYLNTEN